MFVPSHLHYAVVIVKMPHRKAIGIAYPKPTIVGRRDKTADPTACRSKALGSLIVAKYKKRSVTASENGHVSLLQHQDRGNRIVATDDSRLRRLGAQIEKMKLAISEISDIDTIAVT